MRTEQLAATYDRLRREPGWMLLAANNAAEILALLQHLLYERDRIVSASVLQERLTTELGELRRQGRDLRGTAASYLDQWVAAGWVDRHLAEGAREEQYQLSMSTLNVLRALEGLHTERELATETRLTVVLGLMQQLIRDTDPDPTSRLEELRAQRRQIDRKIDAALAGDVDLLAEDRAQERLREVIAQTRGVEEDFRRYGQRFSELYRSFRERAVADERARGQLLADLFNDIDLIAESHAGKTFTAFWRLLTDPEHTANLEASIDVMLKRDFARHLKPAERHFLERLPSALLDGASEVANLRTGFAKGLRAFVARREWQEHRRLNALLAEAQKAALGLRELRRPESQLGASLALTSATFGSVGTWKLYEPREHILPGFIEREAAAEITAEDIANNILESDIDFRGLATNVRSLLAQREQCSIADLVAAFDASQGLGTLLGYIDIGCRHGEVAAGKSEVVVWVTADGQARHARVPLIFFLADAAEAIHE